MEYAKQDKHLYSFLKDMFNIMGNNYGEKYIIGDGGTLYFNTTNIKGCIKVEGRKQVKGKYENIDRYDFSKDAYTLKMLDDKSFELKEKLFVEQSLTALREMAIQSCTIYGDPCCEINKGESSIISRIAFATDLCIPDRYIGLLTKLGDYKVYKDNNCIICHKQEYHDKESETVAKTMTFVCNYQPGKENG